MASLSGEAGTLAIAPLGPERTPLMIDVARWRHQAFLAPGHTLEDSIRQLESVAADPGEAALLASCAGAPAGVCMLVRDELEPRHDLSPWLASLYVVPVHRRRGIGLALVGAVEGHARGLGHTRLYLYTGAAARFYEGCGWAVLERFDWGGEPFALMGRDL